MYRLMQPSDWAEVLAGPVAGPARRHGGVCPWRCGALCRGTECLRGRRKRPDRGCGIGGAGYAAGPPGQLSVRSVRAGQPAPCGPGGYPVCPAENWRGAGFVVAVPASPEQSTLLQDKGFQKAFALRCLPREVGRNLWSQAEFDSVTAKKLCELRAKYWPDTVQLPPGADGGSSAGPVFPRCHHRVQ